MYFKGKGCGTGEKEPLLGRFDSFQIGPKYPLKFFIETPYDPFWPKKGGFPINSTPIYRNEYKYQISAAQFTILKSRAEAILQRDRHTAKDGPYAGIYNIRSVYFDDQRNSCYWENENGTDPREKFRIRIYNHSSRRIMLELKAKQSGKCLKRSCPLTLEQCQILIAGDCLPESPDYPPLLQKLLLQIRTRGLRPVVIVEYDRIPFVFPTGNVRVTLDCNISASSQCSGFLRDDLPLRPILPTGQHILEVKWDQVLPDFIYRMLMLDKLQWTSFSKFYLCRKYSQTKEIL